MDENIYKDMQEKQLKHSLRQREIRIQEIKRNERQFIQNFAICKNLIQKQMIKSDKIRHRRKEVKAVKSAVDQVKRQNAERKEMIANAMMEKYSTHKLP